ncbi:MAG TPA: hypothetical protein VL096_05345, partial [Pirellulaceae bacterium]|nr:hypothetical protein [Pirellulaceae bacterium]
MSNSLENTTRRRWPRITLWRFFVLLTVLTLIASLANTVRQAYIADERLEELHGRFGVARTHSPLQPAVRGLQLPDRRQFR